MVLLPGCLKTNLFLMKKIIAVIIITLLAFLGYQFLMGTDNEATPASDVVDDTAEVVTETTTDTITSGEVEIMLVDRLDGILSEYCLDIAGGNENVDPANGLQAHTCYSYQGDLGTDQVFDAAAFANDSLAMPVYEVCASIADLSAGAEVALSECGDAATPISFNADGTLTPVAAPELCLTAATDSRMGRGSEHQIRDLTLEACSDENSSYQVWQARTAS